MNAQQEIVARIGADTSGFRKGVDDVAAQTARMKNDMRVAFTAGTAGAGQVKGALKGMLDVAGQSGGPLGKMLGGIQDIFRAFQANPIAGMVTVIGTAVAAAAKMAEKAADAALEKTNKAVSDMRVMQGVLRLLAPEIFDARFKFAKEVQGKITAGDKTGLMQMRESEEAKRKELIDRAARANLRRPQIESELAALSSRASSIGATVGPGGQLAPAQIKELEEIGKRRSQLQDELQQYSAENIAAINKEAKATVDRIEMLQAGEKEIIETRKKEQAELVREEERKAKTRLDEQKEQAELVREGERKAKTRLDEQAAAEKGARNTMTLRRELALETAESRDPTGRKGLALRTQFLREDITSARSRAMSPDEKVRKEGTDELIRLQTEAVKLQREIKENTKGGAKA